MTPYRVRPSVTVPGETADSKGALASFNGGLRSSDFQIVDANGAKTIRNGMMRTVHTGDLLYVPPGVPHHFTDMKGFRAWLIRYDVEGWSQSIQPAGRGGAQ